MTEQEQKALRMRNIRIALIFGSIAVAGFFGVILRNWFMMQK